MKKGQGKDNAAGGREKKRQKDEDESVWEMMGIKGEMGQENHGQKLNV